MKGALKVIIALANVLALLSMCSACMVIFYQPELPKKN
ncbi:MAG: cyclic lactone autoinducer peptide [Firmicutes bacterium]|nr:cyclic lactone autoinducer peptide [Bacillota bacterium]